MKAEERLMGEEQWEGARNWRESGERVSKN